MNHAPLGPYPLPRHGEWQNVTIVALLRRRTQLPDDPRAAVGGPRAGSTAVTTRHIARDAAGLPML